MTKIQLCSKCKCLTEHTYKSKVDNRTAQPKELDKIATVATLGIYALADKALGKLSKKYFESNHCKCISIH